MNTPPITTMIDRMARLNGSSGVARQISGG
jgi:hypothetical protein